MPHCFLHVRNGPDLLQDPDGQELADLAAAKEEAVAVARDLMAECLRSGQPLGLGRMMVIADENGDITYEVAFRAALPRDTEDRLADLS